MFAVVTYVYQNPPAAPDGETEKPAILFEWAGIAKVTSEVMTGR